MLLTMVASSVRAQVVTDRASAGDPLTFDQFQAFAGTGKHFALVAPSSNALVYNKWFSFSKDGYPEILTTVQLFELENSATGDGWYNIKRVSDGLYVSTEGGNFAEEPKMDFKLVNRLAGDFAPEFSNSDLHVSLDNADGNHYNCNTTNLGFRGGTGGYSTYVMYGPFYLVTVNCVDGNDTPLQDAVTYIVKDGTTVDAPEFAGRVAQGAASVTVSGADEVLTVVYAASSYDYSVVINNAVDGMTVTVKGDAVTDGASVSYAEAVAESDVVVTFPSEYSYMGAHISISGTTITVDCEDARWPINFPKTQTFTRSDRHINSVTFDIEGEDQTLDGLYENTSTLCYQDLTATRTVRLPAGTTVTTTFNIAGIWQHAFVYIDLNNDGDYTDEGELVTKINQGNPGSNFSLPEFTTPESGTYRMRIKTDWSSEDPGGNPGDPETHNNYIIDNGGMIVDVMLETFTPSCFLTFVVKDTDDNTLFTSEPIVAELGSVVTTLPPGYQKAEFYDYNTLDLTITEENTTATFTATPKETPLFKFTADATAPVWYKLDLKGGANYLTYVADGTPNVTLPTEDADDETVQWAFIGNPYGGFLLINRAANDPTLVLGSASPASDGNNGGNTFATLATAGTQDFELWYPSSSTYATDGFFLFNSEGFALNRRSDENLAYWTSGHDLGSTFTATEVSEVPTGIKTMENGKWTMENGSGVSVIYDLSGRRVQSSILNPQSQKKGLYIVNGKKTIVK